MNGPLHALRLSPLRLTIVTLLVLLAGCSHHAPPTGGDAAEPSYAAVARGRIAIEGGLLQRIAPVPHGNAGTNAFTCTMEVGDFDAVSFLILDGGGEVALPKFAIAGRCWQGYFLDTEGNVFGIFQSDPNAE